MNYLKIFLFSLICCLVSCSVPPYINRGSSLITDDNRGYVLLGGGESSTTMVKFVSHQLWMKNIQNGKKVIVNLSNGSKDDFSDREGNGALQLIPLASGNYEVYGSQMYLPVAQSPATSIPFSIVPGKITYIGRFMLSYRCTQCNINYNYLVNMHGGQMIHTKHLEDIDIAKRKFSVEITPQNLILNQDQY